MKPLLDTSFVYKAYDDYYLRYPDSKIQYRYAIRFWDSGQVLWSFCPLDEKIDEAYLESNDRFESLSFTDVNHIHANMGWYTIDDGMIYIQILNRTPHSLDEYVLYRGPITAEGF